MFLEPSEKPRVIYTGNSLEFGKSCEDLSWNHRSSTPPRSETNGIARRVVRRIIEGTSAVQGVRLALGTLRHPEPGMGLFFVPFFRSEWVPLVGPGDRFFFFFNQRVSSQKVQEITERIGQKCMSFDTSSLKNVLLT